MLSHTQKCQSGYYGGIISTFAFVHLTPGRQLDLFQHIWRVLAKDGLLIIASAKDALPSVKTSYEGKKCRVGVIE